MPPTPPPDIDLEAWSSSLDLVEAWTQKRLGSTDFGARLRRRGAQIDTVREGPARWSELARSTDAHDYAARLRPIVRERATLDEMPRPTCRRCPRQWAGLDRYCVFERGRFSRGGPFDRASRQSPSDSSDDEPEVRSARHRPQRRPQHLRPRRRHARAISRASMFRRLRPGRIHNNSAVWKASAIARPG